MSKHCALGFFIFVNVVGALVSFAMVNIGIILLVSTSVVNEYTKPFIRQWSSGLFPTNDSLLNLMATNYHPVVAPMGYPLLVFGCIIFVFAILGIVGAAMRNTAILITYAVLAALLLLGTIILVAVYFSNRTPFYAATNRFVEDEMRRYTNLNSTDTRVLLAGALMRGYKCCGYNNGTDYTNRGWPRPDRFNGMDFDVPFPIPCCKFFTQSQGQNTCPPNFTVTNSYITLGCRDAIGQQLSAIGDTIALIGIAPMLLTAIAFGLAVYIIYQKRNQY
ncbi:hypothetical protein D915_001958 [Fasciola hepatica]|uniref:Tetraspanin n=1 Tax=Fasciola hepatica TaxID=6192 RepID=A0A4E0S3D0_FASHE|nr:hypothetical protein D915_001958 [Fasciola hepatica]